MIMKTALTGLLTIAGFTYLVEPTSAEQRVRVLTVEETQALDFGVDGFMSVSTSSAIEGGTPELVVHSMGGSKTAKSNPSGPAPAAKSAKSNPSGPAPAAKSAKSSPPAVVPVPVPVPVVQPQDDAYGTTTTTAATPVPVPVVQPQDDSYDTTTTTAATPVSDVIDPVVQPQDEYYTPASKSAKSEGAAKSAKSQDDYYEHTSVSDVTDPVLQPQDEYYTPASKAAKSEGAAKSAKSNAAPAEWSGGWDYTTTAATESVDPSLGDGESSWACGWSEEPTLEDVLLSVLIEYLDLNGALPAKGKSGKGKSGKGKSGKGSKSLMPHTHIDLAEALFLAAIVSLQKLYQLLFLLTEIVGDTIQSFIVIFGPSVGPILSWIRFAIQNNSDELPDMVSALLDAAGVQGVDIPALFAAAGAAAAQGVDIPVGVAVAAAAVAAQGVDIPVEVASAAAAAASAMP